MSAPTRHGGFGIHLGSTCLPAVLTIAPGSAGVPQFSLVLHAERDRRELWFARYGRSWRDGPELGGGMLCLSCRLTAPRQWNNGPAHPLEASCHCESDQCERRSTSGEGVMFATERSRCAFYQGLYNETQDSIW